MINAEQIRAARGLLDWKISDLAKLTGLTINGINKIEREYVQGRRDTLETIQSVFEKAGIEFLPNSGLRKKDRIIEIHEGDAANKILVEDFYNTLRDTGGEILIAHLVEGDATRELGEDFLKEQFRKRKEANITHRVLVRADDPNLIPPLDTYHVLPDEYFVPYPFYLYGSKLALFSRRPAPKVIIINDARFADSIRKLFDFVWDHTKTPDLRRKKRP